MRGKKEARSSVPAPERAMRTENTVDHVASNPPYDFSTAREREQGFIQSFLLQGAENALPAAQLVKLAGLSDTRVLRHLVERERAGGALICSKADRRGGYFLPATREEIAGFKAMMLARTKTTFKVIAACDRALKELDGQERVEGW